MPTDHFHLLHNCTDYYHIEKLQQEEEQDTAKWYIDGNHYSSINPKSNTSHCTCIIVQDSAPGPADKMLDVTSYVNCAYSKRWSHDYLQFTGVSVGSQPWQAMFNQPFLLLNRLRARLLRLYQMQRKLQVVVLKKERGTYDRVSTHKETLLK